MKNSKDMKRENGMAKRKLDELNLLDDFLFGKMLTYPGIGEKFVRELLKITNYLTAKLLKMLTN